MSETGTTITETAIQETVAHLKHREGSTEEWGARAIVALATVGELWEQRRQNGWMPPDGSPFPWEQVKLSLSALIPGMKTAGEWRERANPTGRSVEEQKGKVAALILAGNTPLMSWSPLCACLLAGFSVFVKMSREETLWPRLFVESLAEVDEGIASRVHLDVWPGAEERTTELVQMADVVIAFGSDSTIAALREKIPSATPFFGYGHSISIGLSLGSDTSEVTRGFARDALMYQQQGCLSLQTIVTAGSQYAPFTVGRDTLPHQLATIVDELNLSPITEPSVAARVRRERDLALFNGWKMEADPHLRWTVLYQFLPVTVPVPVGFGFIHVLPLEFWPPPKGEQVTLSTAINRQLETLRGKVSSISVAGEIELQDCQTLKADGVSRICKPGEMQMPPLDWPNGNFDLLTELLELS